MKKPLVAIVGRPNVGKSTLFNRIVKRRTAIVEDYSGLTRDRNYATASWHDHSFLLVDTGGIIPEAREEMLAEIHKQAMLAVEEADLVLFMLDGGTGAIQADIDLARELRLSEKPVIHVVNKVDGPKQEAAIADFYSLAPNELIPLSALHGRGLSELLDKITGSIPKAAATSAPETDYPKVAVVGKPNSGKSTLINSLTGKERLIVSPVAGTTRDAIDTECVYHDRTYLFIDTAGLRKKSRIDISVEYYSMIRTLKTIDRADVALIMIDAAEGFTDQDQKIAGIVHDAGKGAVIILNKWDLTEKTEKHLKQLTQKIRNSAWFLKHAPVLSISALTRQRTTKIFRLIDRVIKEHRKRISTAGLNEFTAKVRAEKAPPLYRGAAVRIKYITQIKTSPPGFVLFANRPKGLTPAYLRFLERRIREEFGFEGTPIRFFIKKKE